MDLTLEERGRPSMSAAIEFRDVSFATPQGRVLLDRISLSLDDGSTTAILGRSGSGKTTLLRTVNRMVEPTAGEVLVHGQSVRSTDLITLRRGMGYVIQETGLFPHFTVERNVGLVPEAQGQPRTERLRRSHELLNSVGLEPGSFAKRYPHQLSGGQRQRVGLARALAAEPKIMLMDEPFGALDQITRDRLNMELVRITEATRATVLFVTHSIREAVLLSDRVAVMSPRPGRIVSVIDIDLPRPRSLATRDNPRYLELIKVGAAELEEGYARHDQ
jgi:osmoprotectant transport system ATP-binding protein